MEFVPARAAKVAIGDLDRDDWRCLVVDLGSIAEPTERALVGTAVLDRLWERRADRRPVLIIIDEAERICFANGAAEGFFQASRQMLVRQRLPDIVPFASPVLGAVAQTRHTASTGTSAASAASSSAISHASRSVRGVSVASWASAP